jgi:hypothetical protein
MISGIVSEASEFSLEQRREEQRTLVVVDLFLEFRDHLRRRARVIRVEEKEHVFSLVFPRHRDPLAPGTTHHGRAWLL